MTKVDLNTTPRICQGDIISNVEYIEKAVEINGELIISKIIFPYVIVLTQDCDLEQYFRPIVETSPTKNDKHLVSVIVAPLYNYLHFIAGEHLSELNLKMQSFARNKSPIDVLNNNKNPRYHVLNFEKEVKVPDSVIDFKHYFSANSETLLDLKKKYENYVVKELYREDISLRFANFLSRIGLPNA